MATPNKLLLVTGATGFLGHHLVPRLIEEGYALRLMVRSPEGRTDIPAADRVEVVDGDVLDVTALRAAVQGVDEIVHAAATVSYDPRRARTLHGVNGKGTGNVVNAALDAEVKRIVHISSIAATGRIGNGETVDESTPWRTGPHHFAYSLSKRAAELEVHRGIAEGLPAVMLNPGVILGTGDWRLGTPKIFSTIDSGMPAYPSGVTGFVAARDVAEATVAALRSDFRRGERFILVAENLTQRAFLTQVAEAIGKVPPRIPIPALVGPLAGWLAEKWAHLRGREAFISRPLMRSARNKTYYDGSRAEEVLGLTYTPIAAEIQTVAKAYRDAFSRP